MRLVVFDCDGTLVDSQANIIRAMNDTFERNCLTPPDAHAVRRIVGLSLIEIMKTLLPGAEPRLQHRLADDYRTAFQRLRDGNRLDPEPLFPGVREGLEALSAEGRLMGVATGKSDRGLALCLAHHGLAHHFVTLQTADRHPSKPHPSMLLAACAEADVGPADAVIVGDTQFDMAMGVAAGVRAIGVDWGYHDAHELVDAGASQVVGDFAALLAALRVAT